MNNAAIHHALDSITDGLIGMTTPFGPLEVYPENIAQNPVNAETAYIEVYFMPAPTAYVGLQGGAGRIFTGVYQLTLVTPPGRGTQKAEIIADQICEVFNQAGHVMAGNAAVTFPVPAYHTAAMNDNTRSQLPITIMYSCCAG